MVLDTATGQLLPQHQQNLKQLLADLRRIGFNQVNIRFTPYGELDPRGFRNGAEAPWNDYHTWLYNRYWTAVHSTIDSVNAWVPTDDSLKVIYDLSAEMATYIHQTDGRQWNATYSFGHVAEHSRRLWRDYLARYGNRRTIGFTFGNGVLYHPADSSRQEVVAVVNHEVYDSVGQRPKAYAFDIYPNNPGGTGLVGCEYPCYDKFFEEIARQVRRDSIVPQVLVWEGLYNNKTFADAVREANKKLNLGIPYVMQWPTREQPWGGNFTEPFPKNYDNYLELSR